MSRNNCHWCRFTVQPLSDHWTDLFPALGYFGATELDCIDLVWRGTVRGIRLVIPADGNQNVLNVVRLELTDSQGLLVPSDVVGAVTQSSVHQNDPQYGPEHLLRGRGIHTQLEAEPWWQILFPSAMTLRRLRLFNRRDRWGLRARHLRIVFLVSGRWQTVFDAASAQHALSVLKDCLASAGPIEVGASLLALRHRLRSSIAQRLRTLQLSPAQVPWRSVLALVDIWCDFPPDEEDLTLMAAWLSRGNGLGPLLPLAERLKSPTTLLALQTRLQEIASMQGMGHLIITRHGIQRSYLMTHREAFLDAAEALIAHLKDLDYSAILGYGTLLGAVRGSTFIPHDDDMDLLLPCRATDEPGVTTEMTQLAERLRDVGYHVEQLLPQSLNIHIRDGALGVILDLFPCWQDESGRLNLHMEKMAIRSIDAKLVLPPGQVQLHGRAMPAPADPPGFLLERYGTGWAVPDQFFEWPWPLKEPSASEGKDAISFGLVSTNGHEELP